MNRIIPIAVLLVAASQASLAAAGERYAFLVAVRKYDKTQLTSLRYTENDVERLRDRLLNAGYDKDNVVLLTQTTGAEEARFLPLAKNILQELKLLCRELKPDDSLLLGFSGHGVQFKGEDSSYFCPMDARLQDKSTLVSMGDVFQLLGDEKVCAARNRVLLVDACRNNPLSTLGKGADEIELDAAGKKFIEPRGGVVALLSCSQGERSYEHPTLQQGVFFNYLIEGLGGPGDLDQDGEVTFSELEQYAVKNVQKYVRVELGESQTPERLGKTQGLLTIAKVDRRPIAPPATSAKPPPFIPGNADGRTVTLQAAVSAAAEELAAYLKSHNESSLGVGDFPGPDPNITTAGPGIAQMFIEQLTQRGIAVTGGACVLSGRYVLDDKKGRNCVRVNCTLVDVTGTLREDFVFQGAKGAFTLLIEDAADVAALMGATVQLFTQDRNEDRIKDFHQRLLQPQLHVVNGTRCVADPESPYGVEVLVADRPCVVNIDGGVGTVALKKGDVYAIRLYNNSPVAAAARLTIDGLNVFTFSQIKDAAGQSKFSLYLIPPKSHVTILGWHLTNERVSSFVVTRYAESAAASLQQPDGCGTITAAFAAAWPKDGRPPSDESLQRRGDQATGFGPEAAQGVVEKNHSIGALRATVSLRYDK